MAINKDKHIGTVLAVIKVVFIIVSVFIIGASNGYAQITPDSLQTDTVPAIQMDSLALAPDTVDAAVTDSIAGAEAAADSPINEQIDYNARDSIDNDVINKKVYLYGDATVTYGSITLKAERIVYDFESYTVHAEGVQDSLGAWIGLPQFVDGPSEFDARMMDYNFKTKKGYITLVETEVIEGTLTGREVKTVEGGNVIYIRKGEYCPCEDPNAKTRFKISKLKVIKDDKIVTGPGYMAFYGIPTPLAFPFGFFPNTEKRQAGIIIPSYGNGQRQGYFLNDAGFYMPIGEYADTKILGDIYSRGSWGVQNISRYTRKYKYDGNFDVQYNVNKVGDPDLPNYQEGRNFFINWMHRQDRKAKPNSNFSADIRAGSQQNFRTNLNASQNDFLTNTFRSNIRYDKTFYDSPWSFSANAGHDQNSQTGNYNFILPQLAVTRARTFPLAGLFNDSPKQQFYEKIGVTYNSTVQNTLSATEGELRMNNIDNLLDQFRNGARHNAAVSTSLKAGAFSINPSFNYTERWYLRTYGRKLDDEMAQFVRDTISGFDRNGDWNMGANITTKVYGMYSFKGRKLQAIRHTLTPSLSFNYRPDFDPNVYGFYGLNGDLGSYSPYESSLYGGPPAGRSGVISLSLVNNLEAKFASRRDTSSKFVKVPLLENLAINGSYNMAVDSLNFSMINISGRTKITKYANINFRGVFDPYVYVPNQSTGAIQRIDLLLAEQGQSLATFEGGNVAINAAGLGSSMFRRNQTVEGPIPEEGALPPQEDPAEDQPFLSDFTIPWTLNFGYSLDARRNRESIMYTEGYQIEDSIAFTQSLQVNGSVELFKRISINFVSGYDFVNKELTPTTFLVNVDLNCWEFNARIVPFGIRRSYSLSLNIKSTMLKDLKLERNINLSPDRQGFYL